MKKIIFLGDARSYHVVDWYNTVKKLNQKKEIKFDFFTDLVESEGHYKLLNISSDNPLFLIDKLLFLSQSLISDKLRNLLKLVLIFPQVLRIRKYTKKHCDIEILFHAHSFYYILLCSLSGVKYIATPMGSDYLLKPSKSKIYFKLAGYSLSKAWKITVDSIKLKHHIKDIFGIENVSVVQNGIDTKYILDISQRYKEKTKLRFLSIRGLTELYQISKFLEARNSLKIKIPVDLVYPFKHLEYEKKVTMLLADSDKNIGRVNKNELYFLMLNSLAVISIPISDSSPRSVYEAIFCGAFVITTELEWVAMLTPNMRSRIVVVKMLNANEINSAIKFINGNIESRFNPTDEDIKSFDQNEQMKFLINNFYV